MAANTPEPTPEATNRLVHESPYNSKTLTITVGYNRIPFSVHSAKLAPTKFFNVHQPLSDEERATWNTHVRDVTEVLEVKLEEGVYQSVQAVVPDFHLDDRSFLRPLSFEVFVKYLYSEPPIRPANRAEMMILFRTYGIAILYGCYGLQNRIIDCLRQYYSRTKVQLQDLIWVCERFGDDTNRPLNAYLVEQVAFEISDGGYAEFTAANAFFKIFLEEGNRKIRAHLFEAVAQHSRDTMTDPATARNKFHVYETGPTAGRPKN